MYVYHWKQCIFILPENVEEIGIMTLINFTFYKKSLCYIIQKYARYVLVRLVGLKFIKQFNNYMNLN